VVWFWGKRFYSFLVFVLAPLFPFWIILKKQFCTEQPGVLKSKEKRWPCSSILPDINIKRVELAPLEHKEQL